MVTVECEGEEIEAMTYVACCEHLLDSPIAPYDWYLEHVVRGAKERGLPESYIEDLEKLSSQIDQNAQRREKQLSIWA